MGTRIKLRQKFKIANVGLLMIIILLLFYLGFSINIFNKLKNNTITYHNESNRLLKLSFLMKNYMVGNINYATLNQQRQKVKKIKQKEIDLIFKNQCCPK